MAKKSTLSAALHSYNEKSPKASPASLQPRATGDSLAFVWSLKLFTS